MNNSNDNTTMTFEQQARDHAEWSRDRFGQEEAEKLAELSANANGPFADHSRRVLELLKAFGS